jgi:hypothetical protein
MLLGLLPVLMEQLLIAGLGITLVRSPFIKIEEEARSLMRVTKFCLIGDRFGLYIVKNIVKIL